MKAQPNIKKGVDLTSNMIASISKNKPHVITFDKGGGFDSHWEYSYIMDYISLHKIKKRKS